MAEWLDTDAKKRVGSLPARFDALARRALLHTTAQQMPQIAGGGRHRRSTARELSAQLARALDTQHVSEADALHAAGERLEHWRLRRAFDGLRLRLGIDPRILPVRTHDRYLFGEHSCTVWPAWRVRHGLPACTYTWRCPWTHAWAGRRPGRLRPVWHARRVWRPPAAGSL